jgi:uncharacterized membrane protein YqhA
MRPPRSLSPSLVFLRWLPVALATGAIVALVLAAAALALASGTA